MAECVMGIFPDSVVGLFFALGAFFFVTVIKSVILGKKARTELLEKGVTKTATCKGSRQSVARTGKKLRNLYYINISFQVSETETCQTELNVDGSTFSNSVDHTTTYEVVHLPDNPTQVVLKSELQHKPSYLLATGQILFLAGWIAILVLGMPWCYSPFWGIPLGLLIGLFTNFIIRTSAGLHILGTGTVVPMNDNPMATPQAAPKASFADEMVKLTELKKSGALTEEEFQAAKAKLMAEMV